MANEIRGLASSDDGETIRALFLFPIAAPLQYTPVGGAATNVVPTPSAGLPADAALVTSAAEKAALDAGTLAFAVVAIGPSKTASKSVGAELVAEVKGLYQTMLTQLQAAYPIRYRYFGALVNFP